MVIGLNSDKSISALKGKDRPIQSEYARAKVLASLISVDAIITFSEKTPINLINALRPDVLIKGKDYSLEKVVGAKEVKSYGGKVFLANLLPEFSTTKTIQQLNKTV